jgi:hypothetical protein
LEIDEKRERDEKKWWVMSGDNAYIPICSVGCHISLPYSKYGLTKIMKSCFISEISMYTKVP